MKPLHILTCKALLVLVVVLICNSTALAERCDTLALIVAQDNPITNISEEQLQRIYLGKVITFSGNLRIQLVEHDCCLDFFYNRILHKTKGQVRKHWLKNIFSGRDCIPPTLIRDSKELLEHVAKTKGAIGFLPLHEINDSVKLLSVDGAQPSDSGYVLITCDNDQSKP